MSGQSGKNIVVAYKVESVFNTPVSGGSATQFRANAGSGMSLKRGKVESNEIRKDGQQSMFRLGYKEAAGAYEGDLSVGTFDALIAAVLRNTFATLIALTSADFTTVTTTAHTIVFAANSPISKGLRFGDVLQLSAMPDSGNNKNVRVTGLSATTITVAETLVVNAVGSGAPTITRPKKVINGASFTRSSYTIEEYYEDLDDSKLFSGCRVTSVKIAWAPDQMVKITIGFEGADMSVPGNAAAPNFTSPTLTTTVGMTANDAVIRVNGADVATLTSGELTIDLSAKGLPVVGSVVTPDIYENACKVTGQVTGVRTSMANAAAFIAETEFEIELLCVDNASEPKNFGSFYLPRCKYTGVDAPFGNDGAIVETLPFEARAKDTTSGYDATTVAFSTSAA